VINVKTLADRLGRACDGGDGTTRSWGGLGGRYTEFCRIGKDVMIGGLREGGARTCRTVFMIGTGIHWEDSHGEQGWGWTRKRRWGGGAGGVAAGV